MNLGSALEEEWIRRDKWECGSEVMREREEPRRAHRPE